MTRSKKWTFATTAATAALIALAAISTMVIRVPIPATTGYFNIGDVFVVLAGLWLGPVPGLLVGAIGPTIADAVGFPVFIPATMITKGAEGLIVGLIASRASERGMKLRTIAAFTGGAIVVGGYFLFEAIVYPAVGDLVPAFAVTDLGAAIVEILPNTIQGVVGAIGGLALWKALSGFNPGVDN